MSEPTVAILLYGDWLASRRSTCCGGLVVLAKDIIRAAADVKVPRLTVSLLHQRGYSTHLRLSR